MPVRVDEAVDAIKAATEGGQLVIQSSMGVDGLDLEVQNWQRLYPVLENLLDQSWFPEKAWVQELIVQNRDYQILKLSPDRLNQLQNVVDQVQQRLPIILEAWASLVHLQSSSSFHVNINAH